MPNIPRAKQDGARHGGARQRGEQGGGGSGRQQVRVVRLGRRLSFATSPTGQMLIFDSIFAPRRECGRGSSFFRGRRKNNPPSSKNPYLRRTALLRSLPSKSEEWRHLSHTPFSKNEDTSSIFLQPRRQRTWSLTCWPDSRHVLLNLRPVCIDLLPVWRKPRPVWLEPRHDHFHLLDRPCLQQRVRLHLLNELSSAGYTLEGNSRDRYCMPCSLWSFLPMRAFEWRPLVIYFRFIVCDNGIAFSDES